MDGIALSRNGHCRVPAQQAQHICDLAEANSIDFQRGIVTIALGPALALRLREWCNLQSGRLPCGLRCCAYNRYIIIIMIDQNLDGAQWRRLGLRPLALRVL